MLTSVRFRGETEDAGAEAKGFEILMPEGDASGWIQGLNLPQRREDALPGGFDKALLAGPDAGEEKIRVLGRANESLLSGLKLRRKRDSRIRPLFSKSRPTGWSERVQAAKEPLWERLKWRSEPRR